MARAASILVGVVVLVLVAFFNPLAGNVLGFCPPSEGLKAIAIDVVVAAIYLTALWLIYRGAMRGTSA